MISPTTVPPSSRSAEVQATAATPQPLLVAADPGFESAVPHDGYRWWYLDAFSEDGSMGLTVIIFVGSVFSPYYARARRRGPADPENYSSINVILYGPNRKRWALTERGRSELTRDARRFIIGPSGVHWGGDCLSIDIHEWCVPMPSLLRGRITASLALQTDHCFALDVAGQHRWWPASPVCQVRVEMESPKLCWEGRGYFDSNAGQVPLEKSFSGWHWMRAEQALGGRIDYDTLALDGSAQSVSVYHDASGGVERIERKEGARVSRLASTPIWRVRRAVRDPSSLSNVVTLEDTPFYARSRLDDETNKTLAMHESLDLNRFKQPWVQTLLPFRMPRRAGW